jgi:hypothetical protein
MRYMTYPLGHRLSVFQATAGTQAMRPVTSPKNEPDKIELVMRANRFTRRAPGLWSGAMRIEP